MKKFNKIKELNIQRKLEIQQLIRIWGYQESDPLRESDYYQIPFNFPDHSYVAISS